MDGTTMWDTLEDLLYGRITVDDDLPLIEVVREDGKWWALTGNRRLYLYRKLEELKVIHTIPVVAVSLDSDDVQRQLMRRKTTDCEGVSIRLRGNQPDWHITQVINTWKASQRNNRYAPSGVQTNAERSGPQRGRSLDRNSSSRANPSNESNAPIVIYPPSIPRSPAAQRSASIERRPRRPVTPYPDRPAIPVPFYDGCGTNPVDSSSRSVRSSLTTRTSIGRDVPRPVAPVPPDRSNSSRTGVWMSSGGVSEVGQNYLEPHMITSQPRSSSSTIRTSIVRDVPRPVAPAPPDPSNSSRTGVWMSSGGMSDVGQNYLEPSDVITSQPRGSTDPIMSSDDSCCSCCADSCCSCCCCCFPCCKKSSG